MMIPKPWAERFWGLLLAALISAGLLAAAMPGRLGWWPLLSVALVPLLMGVTANRPGRSALAGFGFGLVYHLALLYWILIVLGRYGGLPLGLALLGLGLLSAYMACYPALVCLLLSLLSRHVSSRGERALALVWGAPILWVGGEYLRSVLFTGFPWMDLGYGLYGQAMLLQAADLGGHHLLSFALVQVNALIAVALSTRRQGAAEAVASGSGRRTVIAALTLLLGLGGYCLGRYQQVEAAMAEAPTSRIVVAQGNIRQDLKWSPAVTAATVDTYTRLTVQAMGNEAADLVVWPETALPFAPDQDPLIGRVIDLATASGTWVLTGAPLVGLVPKPEGGDRLAYWNGAILVGPGGQDGGQHAKRHLVPFGEYVPLRQWLPFLQPLVVHLDDFTPGTEKGPLVRGAMRLGMLICYESIFPDIARESVDRGANLLVNITNDAWYGRSSAPYQSLAMATLRAVENRRALIRAANTGISGFVDPLGRVLAPTELFVEASKAQKMPRMESATVFAMGGHWFGAACALLSLALLVLGWRRRP